MTTKARTRLALAALLAAGSAVSGPALAATNDITLASRATGAGAAKGNDTSWSPVISTDGRYVAFLSHATNLNSADTTRAAPPRARGSIARRPPPARASTRPAP